MVEGPTQSRSESADPPAAGRTARPAPSRWRRTWLSPTGLCAIAAIAAVLVGVGGVLLQNRGSAPASTPVGPGGPAAAGSAEPPQPALFVYGSSMPGMSRHDLISRYVERSARDTVKGSAYDSGLGYPMAKFGGDGVIQGVVLWLDRATAQEAMTEMTRVEAGLFHPVSVRTASGVTAQAYEWIGSTEGYPRIDAWDGSTAQYGARIGWQELAVGDCFQSAAEDLVITSWCAAPHALEAYHAGVIEGVKGDARLAAEKACEVAFTPFIGRTQSDSELTVRVFSESASVGSRQRFVCGVGIAGQSFAGTLEESRR